MFAAEEESHRKEESQKEGEQKEGGGSLMNSIDCALLTANQWAKLIDFCELHFAELRKLDRLDVRKRIIEAKVLRVSLIDGNSIDEAMRTAQWRFNKKQKRKRRKAKRKKVNQ